jgi:hypothetical protein
MDRPINMVAFAINMMYHDQTARRLWGKDVPMKLHVLMRLGKIPNWSDMCISVWRMTGAEVSRNGARFVADL